MQLDAKVYVYHFVFRVWNHIVGHKQMQFDMQKDENPDALFLRTKCQNPIHTKLGSNI
jgi:hypothetical protein